MTAWDNAGYSTTTEDQDMEYGKTVTLDVPFEDAVPRVKARRTALRRPE